MHRVGRQFSLRGPGDASFLHPEPANGGPAVRPRSFTTAWRPKWWIAWFAVIGGSGSRTMRIAIVGAGGVGGYYGAKLTQAGHDVTILAPGRPPAATPKNGAGIKEHPTHLPRPA